MTDLNAVSSLYLHFPHCRHLCNYCDFFKSVPTDFDEARETYQSRLEQQWHKHQAWFDQLGYQFAPLETLYFGGGTPSLWDLAGAHWFKDFILSRLSLRADCEWTMEVNPAAWSESGLSAWEELGVNRFSIGVQSFDERYLKVLDRVHHLDDVEQLLTRMQGKHFSVDLMLGLPFTSTWKRDLQKEIEELISRGAEHFSVYILTVKENYRYFQELPSEEEIEAEFFLTSEVLRKHGYEHYEVSNFAKPHARAKHNMRYWLGQSVAALGPSAVGYLAGSGHRYKWKGQVDEFDVEKLDEQAQYLEQIYLKLRLKEGLKDFASSLTTAQLNEFQALCEKWRQKNWLSCESGPNDLILSPAGFLMMDSVMNDLMLADLLK